MKHQKTFAYPYLSRAFSSHVTFKRNEETNIQIALTLRLTHLGGGLLLPLVAFLLELGRFDPDVHQLDAHRFLANLLTNFLTDWLRDNLNELLRD